MKTIAVTGHRPPKLGGYSKSAIVRLENFATEELRLLKPDHVITGMAQGWDQAVAIACILNKIPYTAAIPFEGQESVWPKKSQEFYIRLVEAAKDIVIVSEGGYSPTKMQKRNEWMVDNADELVALWDGTSGGTSNCIQYQLKHYPDMPYTNLWKGWVEYAKKNSI